MFRQKAEEVSAYKEESLKAKKKAQKLKQREQEFLHNRSQHIKQLCDNLAKEKRAKVEHKRWESVRKVKENELLSEIKVMNKKERQAKKLEHLEAKILKRLRDTHRKQQMAIEEIQDIFTANNVEGSLAGLDQPSVTQGIPDQSSINLTVDQ